MTWSDPFADLAEALANHSRHDETQGVRIDSSRRVRTGAPEIVYGQGKSAEQISAAILRLLDIEGRALAARVDTEQFSTVEQRLTERRADLHYDPIGRTLTAATADSKPPCTGGRVGLISAGSSDRPQVMEAAAVLHEMGCETQSVQDVGVAGLHRLVTPLRTMVEFDPDALIVAAGMDGVLPGVISGLVAIPIVALPTSTGYGFGGAGLGAMTTMLQACAPGIAVVNIDNGIGAGIMAGLIANRAASQRSPS
jgi:NCAIR mutase (PurE)-related protein